MVWAAALSLGASSWGEDKVNHLIQGTCHFHKNV